MNIIEVRKSIAAFGGSIELLKQLTEEDFEEAKRRALENMRRMNEGQTKLRTSIIKAK